MKKLISSRFKSVSIKKYIIYALGEMVLIIVSLFLALQLNNLNEERKNNNRIENYKLLLISDLEKDLEQVKVSRKLFTTELEEIKNFQNRLNSTNATIDTLIKIARMEFNPNMPPFVRYTHNTWEAVKATGDIGLLDHRILNAFNELHELQKEEEYYHEISISAHANLLESYLKKHAIHTGFINQGYLYNKTWNDINPTELILHFNALLSLKLGVLNGSLKYYERIDSESRKVIKLLEN